AENGNKDAPVVIWMSGGPGCSDEISIFNENGPWWLFAGMEVPEENPFNWCQEYHCLYFDNPVGAGKYI
ncbi:peptidase S10, serine carboxypeptidase, partial [Kipferlia bialata]